MVFTENRSNVKTFRSQTCSVLNLANLAILCQKWGVRDGAVVMKALASHQSGLGSQILASTPYVCRVCCWFSHLLREVFFLVLRFSPLLKNQQFPNSNSTRNQVDEEPLCECATSKSLVILIIYLFI